MERERESKMRASCFIFFTLQQRLRSDNSGRNYTSVSSNSLSFIRRKPIFGLQCIIVVFPDHTHLLSGSAI